MEAPRAARREITPEAQAQYAQGLATLRSLIERGDAPRALAAETEIYNRFVKAIESEEHYERCFAQWREAMLGLGRRFSRPLAPRAPRGGKLRVAFVFHTGSLLGHTEVLLRLLEKRDRATVEPRLYSLFGQNEAFVDGAARVDVPVEAYAGGAGGPHEWLRSRMEASGEDVAVWVSAPPGALFVLGARVAPVQVFWSLKYHPIRGREIDGYLTYGSWGERERVFHGQRWTVCPVPLALDPRPRPRADVEALRAKFPQRVLLGTLAREEKIASLPFLESVVALLRRHPEAGFAWTGRARHAAIQSFLASHGVADRCHFVGWVDTPLYAAILDVFLETFPLGCGITGYQALGAGVPLLSYSGSDTVFGMQYWSEVAARGLPPTRETLDAYPVLAARSPAEYVELASRLIADEPFRAAWQAREKAFYDEEILGIERYSRRFFDSIAAIEPT